MPHIAAVAIFLLIAVIYCKPVLEGKVLQQQDIVNWTGMSHQAFEYKEKHGHLPLWNTQLFSGMPNYQIAMDGKSFLPPLNTILTLGLPKPVSFFFLACICFYILCMALRSNSVVAILGSLAFAYCTYDPIIIFVGHDSKMWAIAYMPALLGGLILLYEKKYFAGFFVTALFATMEIAASHPQINFYFAIVAVFVTISYAIRWIKTRDWKHILIAFSLATLSVLIGLANASLSLLTTAEYTQFTMRGGKQIETSPDGQVKKATTTGLDENYGFSYSAAKNEFMTFLMPDALGGSTGQGFDENSKAVSALTAKGIPQDNAVNIASQLPKYWGGILPSTSGPVYLGAVICILFLIGLVLVDDKYRWWILSAVVFGVVISWGKYFAGFNRLLFEHLPLYNKFRAPSMAMVIPQLLFPIMAVLTLQKIFFSNLSKAELQKSFKKILYLVGGVFVILLLVYMAADFSSDIDTQIKANADTQQAGAGSILVNAMKQGRQEVFGISIFQALLFALATIGVLFAYIKTSIKPVYLVIVLLVLNTINLLYVDSKYLNADNYVDADAYTPTNFTQTSADMGILKDTDPHYRVLNNASDTYNEAITAYYHRSVGGYHPAKLSIYQDLIENQIARKNESVLDMLDTKYLIVPSRQQQGQVDTVRRGSAAGACWFVNEIKFVNGPVEEMKALNAFNPKQTAFVENSFKAGIPQLPVADSAATIKLATYDNDNISYTTSSKTSQFAVLSEIYYPAGWDAYIDGKKAEYVKTDYALRGIYVPAGNHNVEFKFEPASYHDGQKYTYMGNTLLWLSFAGFLWSLWNSRRKKMQVAKA